MAEKRDLPEVVADILIEMQQMRMESNQKWEEQLKFNEAFTAELHAQRTIQERMVTQLENLNERIDKSDKNSEVMAERLINAVLDRLDRVKEEISQFREEIQKRENLEDRVRRIEATLYGKAT